MDTCKQVGLELKNHNTLKFDYLQLHYHKKCIFSYLITQRVVTKRDMLIVGWVWYVKEVQGFLE